MSNFLSTLFPATSYEFIPASKLFPPLDEIEIGEGGEPIACNPLPDVTLFRLMHDYTMEWLIPEKCDLSRAMNAVRNGLRIFGSERDASTFARADSRYYTKIRMEEGVSGAAVRRELTTIRAAFGHAVREERLIAAPKFQMPPAAASRIRFLTREEFKLLMATPKPPRLHRFFTLAFGTGARAAAIQELTWDRVNLAERTIDYRVPGVRYKNKRRVAVPINDWLLPRMHNLYERRTDEYVIGLGPSGRVTTVYHHAAQAYKNAGLKDVRAPRHIARHTFASWLLQAGASIYKVANLLGDTVKMVEDTYAHVLPAHLLEDSNKWNTRTS